MHLSYYSFKLIIYADGTKYNSSRYRNYEAGYTTKHSVFNSWQVQEIFLFPANFTLTMQTKQLPTYWVERGNFSGDKAAVA